MGEGHRGKRFYALCELALRSQRTLNGHLRKSHADRMASIPTPAVTNSALDQREARILAIAKNKFHRRDKSFSHEAFLRRHNNTTRHAKKVEQLKSVL